MNILHIIQRYWPANGGAERHLHEINRRLVADGHAVTVYTTDADDFQLFWNPGKSRVARLSDVYEGVHIRRFQVCHLPMAPLTFPVIRRLMSQLSATPFDTTSLLSRLGQFTPWIPDLRQALAETGPTWDVIGGMTVTYDSLHWPAAEWAARWQRPWLFYPLTHLGEGPHSPIRRYYTMRHQLELSRRATWVLAQTPTERDFLVASGVAVERIIVAGVGINPTDYGCGDGLRARHSRGLSPDTPVVLSLGTASYDKGTLTTLTGLQRLWATGQAVYFVIAGLMQDDFKQVLQRLPREHQTWVHPLGHITESEKHDWLAAANVLCMPSRADSFGIAYLEAWAYGKPVIGAWVGGVQAVIVHEEDGLLVPFGEPEALAEALSGLLTHPTRARSLGERGRAKVYRQYTWDQVYARVRVAYETYVSIEHKS